MSCTGTNGPVNRRARRRHKGPDRESRPCWRPICICPHGVRHLLVGYDLSKDKLYGYVNSRRNPRRNRTRLLEFCRYLRSQGTAGHLVADRLAITGSRWSVHGAEALLQLRAITSNGDFDAYWQHHVAAEHRRIHPHSDRRPGQLPPRGLNDLTTGELRPISIAVRTSSADMVCHRTLRAKSAAMVVPPHDRRHTDFCESGTRGSPVGTLSCIPSSAEAEGGKGRAAVGV